MSEPVAWLYEDESGSKELILDCNGEYARRLIENGWIEAPLYGSHPTTPAVESESADRGVVARKALEEIEASGIGGEHSGDRHARCRDIARRALAAMNGETT